MRCLRTRCRRPYPLRYHIMGTMTLPFSCRYHAREDRVDVGEDMSEHAGQDNGTLRVTIREAAARLGVTEAAIRKRIQRGSLPKELGQDGRVYVYLDLSQDLSHPESRTDHEAALRAKEETIRLLREQLEQANERDRENRRIIAALTSRIPELPPAASQQPSETPDSAAAGPVEPTPSEPTEGPLTEGAQRPWWRRVFGG
jgi:hypothetical protein